MKGHPHPPLSQPPPGRSNSFSKRRRERGGNGLKQASSGDMKSYKNMTLMRWRFSLEAGIPIAGSEARKTSTGSERGSAPHVRGASVVLRRVVGPEGHRRHFTALTSPYPAARSPYAASAVLRGRLTIHQMTGGMQAFCKHMQASCQRAASICLHSARHPDLL